MAGAAPEFPGGEPSGMLNSGDTGQRGARHAIDGGSLVEKTGSFTTLSAAGPALPSTLALDPKRTYLRTNGDAPLDALKIDLGALGIASGSTVTLERLGAYDCGSPRRRPRGHDRRVQRRRRAPGAGPAAPGPPCHRRRRL